MGLKMIMFLAVLDTGKLHDFIKRTYRKVKETMLSHFLHMRQVEVDPVQGQNKSGEQHLSGEFLTRGRKIQ